MSLRDTPFPLEEALRLDALERHRITDTRRDEAFDRVVQVACAALQAPMGAISFLEEERLWVKASHGISQGISLGDTPCDTSFCSHTLMDDDVMVVEDARCDPRFAANLYVTEQDVRFYAGAPLITAEGYPLGTLSVMDHMPRQMADHDRQLLKDIAAVVMGEMQLRRHLGTDSLTGLYTRSFFDEVAGREMIRARRDSRPLAAAFLDVDPWSGAATTSLDPGRLRAIACCGRSAWPRPACCVTVICSAAMTARSWCFCCPPPACARRARCWNGCAGKSPGASFPNGRASRSPSASAPPNSCPRTSPSPIFWPGPTRHSSAPGARAATGSHWPPSGP